MIVVDNNILLYLTLRNGATETMFRKANLVSHRLLCKVN
jgi:hypothetical protein